MQGSGVQTRACAVVHLYTRVKKKGFLCLEASLGVYQLSSGTKTVPQISFQNFLNFLIQVNMSRRAVRNFNRRRRNYDSQHDSLVQLTYGVSCSVGCGHDCDPMFGHMPEPWCCKRCFTSKGTEHDEECDAYVEPTANATTSEPTSRQDDEPRWTRYRDLSGNHWWYKSDSEWFYESTGTKEVP